MTTPFQRSAVRPTEPITELLIEARDHGTCVMERIFPLVYDELQRIARHHLALEATGHTLEATGLVHEAYIRMVDQTRVQWRDRRHFYAIASQAMRRILVDHARRRKALKRGGGLAPIPRDDEATIVEDRLEILISLDMALDRLEHLEPRLCRVVEYRFFGGLSELETAAALGVTDRTVRRDWSRAKAWLYRELSD